MPCQPPYSNPGTPASLTVGMSGNVATRFALVTAITRMRPVLPCCTTVEIGASIICASPDNTPVTDCPPPLYGTCTHFTPVMVMNSSPDRCEVEPLPAEAKVNSPGFAFDNAINSLIDFAGTEGCSATALKNFVIRHTGAKSFNGS